MEHLRGFHTKLHLRNAPKFFYSFNYRALTTIQAGFYNKKFWYPFFNDPKTLWKNLENSIFF